MICALLIFQDPVLKKPLSVLSPWLDMLSRARRDVFADLEAQTHRRFIKTHTPFDGIPFDPLVTYVCVGRDPRDVALSMDNHMDNLRFDRFLAAKNAAAAVDGTPPASVRRPPPRPTGQRERFWLWVEDDTPTTELSSSLRKMLLHLETFWDAPSEADVVMLHFDDLRTDLEGQMRMIAERLDISVSEDRWSDLVRAATFGDMKAKADMTAPNAELWQDNSRFFHQGTSGQWRHLLNDRDIERYRSRVRALGDPLVVDWVHWGGL